MTTFVLVHGGFHGSWCWNRLIPLLETSGHVAFGPSLTGLGDRAHLLSPEVGLSTHIQDIAQLLREQDLQEVILVGHSYGSMVITGVADQLPDRVAHLVYFDTFVPHNGESMADIVPLVISHFRKEAHLHGDGWRVDPLKGLPFGVGGIHGVTEEPDLSWVRAMEGPQPLKTFEEPLELADPDIISRFLRTHIWCTGGGLFFSFIRRLVIPRTLPPKGSGWRLRRLPTGHDAMITMPHELARLLLEVAEVTSVRGPHAPAPVS
jgi:pimeloyl-ACP methyl ester carboxylesterase